MRLIGVRPGHDTIEARLADVRRSNHDLRNALCAASLRSSALQRGSRVAVAALRTAVDEVRTSAEALRRRVKEAV